MKLLSLIAVALSGVAYSAGAEEGMEGAALYQQNCASCHGVDLQGQPDWRSPGPDGRLPAPPHDATGHTWHHSDDILFRITRDGTAAVVGGGYQGNMPGFGDSLSDAQIRAILDYIKSIWPERERAYQRDRTRQE
ncbi:cytochrome c [Sagittula sp. NFXS13]|jgi:mono/diheme cytochrome c family protein|uniref:c-type cytochrome n=1 Tax=Sagittula sp. NFXS13 TaxID=2819095 RepID=UPI0032DE8093